MPDLVFEWDPAKDSLNEEKHGLGFSDAQLLWQDPHSITAPCRDWPEERFMTIATFAGKLWTAIHTYREARAYFGKTQPSRRN